jgi:hypothetical protein
MSTDANDLSAQTATKIAQRAEERFASRFNKLTADVDRMFGWLLLGQWAVAIVIAVTLSPYAWSGKQRLLNSHVPLAIVLGGVLTSLPAYLAFRRPSEPITRHVIAVAQMLWSALLIHLTGGRIETHFHVFGSLAFLAFYRDYRVLLTATLVVASEHFLRGALYPESIYGVANPEWWRFLEHAFWVLFCDAFLMLSCYRGVKEIRELAEQGALMEALAESAWTESPAAARPTSAIRSAS